MKLSEAKAITGGLTTTSKMPCHSYGIPARACNTGGKLHNVRGSVCEGCYALKGCYAWPVVEKAQQRRLDAINADISTWADAMTVLIEHAAKRSAFFRWHDSGDVQSMAHLRAIVDIAGRLPGVLFWLPTKEVALVRAYIAAGGTFPQNLIVRISAPMLDQRPPVVPGCLGSSVHTKDNVPADVFKCRAPQQDGECRNCRACWDRNVPVVSYHKH